MFLYLPVKLDFYHMSLYNKHMNDNTTPEELEHVNVEGFSKKVVAVSRIKSLSEKYILTDYLDGRWVYWEYEGAFEEVKKMLTCVSD